MYLKIYRYTQNETRTVLVSKDMSLHCAFKVYDNEQWWLSQNIVTEEKHEELNGWQNYESISSV